MSSSTASWLPVLLSAAVAAQANVGNNDVIVLVHGFLGWGPSEMGSFNYWGGGASIVDELKKGGHDVRVAVCGPVSSNWDRAAELYAYIKGGTVDYGATHAAQFGHKRYGRTFPGIFPEWGTVGANGSIRRVHFIGHSMGGNTARVLLRLLAEGDANEKKHPDASPLFHGGRVSWVTSITTVNTPHDGTTLISGGSSGLVQSSIFEGVVWPLLKGICSIQGLFGDALQYDFKLDQFGVERREGEGFTSYEERVRAAAVWDEEFRDFATYDLSVAGSREMNSITSAYPSVYYFSYATRATRRTMNPFSSYQVPEWRPFAFLWPFAYLMGSTGDEQFWPNDGVVNTISQNGPKLASKDVIVPWTGKETAVRPGIWNFMGVRDGVDHLENVGWDGQSVEAYYMEIAAKLKALPGN